MTTHFLLSQHKRWTRSTAILQLQTGSSLHLFSEQPSCSLSTALQASAMDAQQRLLLEGCWEALTHSMLASGGHIDSADAARAVGVSVGISYNEYYLNAVHQVKLFSMLRSCCCNCKLTDYYSYNLHAGHDSIHRDKRHPVCGLWPHLIHLWAQGEQAYCSCSARQCKHASKHSF